MNPSMQTGFNNIITDSNSNSFSMRVEELFVVQRCWQAGPNVFAPVDLLRLFPARQEAEEVAYHSAHAWSRAHDDANVRTLLLPPSQVQRQPQGASPSFLHPTPTSTYAFVTAGAMFWVRPLLMTMTDNSFLIRSEGGNVGANHNASIQACAVVTDGVIGGSGKRFGRGFEIGHGRVFGCSAAAATSNSQQQQLSNAHSRAQQVCDACNSSSSSSGMQLPSSVVHPLPIGKTMDYFTCGRFMHDWPLSNGAASDGMISSASPSASSPMVSSHDIGMIEANNKRTMDAFEVTSCNNNNHNNTMTSTLISASDLSVVSTTSSSSPSFDTCSTPAFVQTAKRRRRMDSFQSTITTTDEDMMMG
eukprot:CAMPEP_0119567684 /NCGR_PEP_ID=MMETSP1352-20130426/36674_1 /TAXON_ID=265584 /ORGANISM="Stauroneis constricta, Strain CCMP1120" /LENGTH=359 /DNA_ID=CAMNT_0007616963 /DNA_START=202 /DNA_END=1281 /DNA_ORIENTATION=-